MRATPKYIVGVLVLFLLPFATYSQAKIEDEEYQVYSAIAAHLYGDDLKKQFVFAGETQEHPNNVEFLMNLTKDQELVSDFASKFKESGKIENHFSLKSNVLVLEEGTHRQLLQAQGPDAYQYWEEFKKNYNTAGVIYVSRVGFNKKRDKALVVFGMQIGATNGEGYYYFLVRDRERWKIEKTFPSWDS